MQHVRPSDYMTGSAKRAVDAAMRDARAQAVGATPNSATPMPTATPKGAAPTPTAASGRPGASA